jgi:hypothetical protein
MMENGTTYSFDPAAAGIGTHTITYTFRNAMAVRTLLMTLLICFANSHVYSGC